MKDNTQRFSNRVENYILYRPCYPEGVFESLKAKCQLSETSIIADIGSGTGLLAEGFLHLGCLVYGVEPNHQMREAGERLLQKYDHFRNISGTAEQTTLARESIDFVTAGQAFHWFDPQKARGEFQRILKPSGWVVLVWNERCGAAYPLGIDYEKLLEAYAVDYDKVDHKQLDDQVLRAFLGKDFQSETFENSQSFDFEGLKGRLLSSSYSPEPGQPGHDMMLSELRRILDAHQIDGRVVFLYETNLYYGRFELILVRSPENLFENHFIIEQ
jgi:SAM-dependent methyltransferase